MEIYHLQEIGKKLFNEISLIRHSPHIKTSTGVGAAGDRTYPIDSMAEDIIISGLKKLNEPLTIISEEIGVIELNGGGRKVLVDPVDGSKNAVSGIPIFCSSIAFADGDTLNTVNLAYIINLISGEEFWAKRNCGTFLNGKKVHTQADNKIHLISYEAQVPGKNLPGIMPLLAESGKTRCLGSTALDLAYMSCGSISVFVSPSLSRSFDFAGGWLLLKEAGGIITDIKGKDMEQLPLELNACSTLLAAGNNVLHKKALNLLGRNT